MSIAIVIYTYIFWGFIISEYQKKMFFNWTTTFFVFITENIMLKKNKFEVKSNIFFRWQKPDRMKLTNPP